MRIILNNTEFYFFKDLMYTRPRWYYDNKDTTLADKYFSTANYGLDKNSALIIDMLIHSSKAPSLENEPQEVYIGVEEQLEELLAYLDKDFQISMDEKNRFYKIKTVRKSMFHSTPGNKIEYFSWKDVIQLYNIGHIHFDSTVSNKYLKLKYHQLKEFNKKYVYLNLKRIKGKGFEIESEKVISLPR